MKNITAGIILGLVFAGIGTTIEAEELYDYDSGSYKEVEIYDNGGTLEIYDYDTNSYSEVDTDIYQDDGNTIDAQGYDYDNGEYRSFQLQK